MSDDNTDSIEHTPQKAVLIIGDETFTFVQPFLESIHYLPDEVINVASCLPEDKMPDDYRPNYLALTAQKITVHFGVNPAQLRNSFSLSQFSRIIVVLPGIACTGFPSFIDRKHSALFKLRLHIFIFSFFKSSKNVLQSDGLIQFLWPRQNEHGHFDANVPWHSIDIQKIGPFCDFKRSESDDKLLDIQAFQEWRPLIHNEPTNSVPSFLNNCVFYSWRLPLSSEKTQADNQDSTQKNDYKTQDGTDNKEANLLFVPAEILSHSIEVLPHVNELFKFEMQTHDGSYIVVSKPTLKFDPRLGRKKNAINRAGDSGGLLQDRIFRNDGSNQKHQYGKKGFNGPTRGGNFGPMTGLLPMHDPRSLNPMMRHLPPPPPEMGLDPFLGSYPPSAAIGSNLIPNRWYDQMDPITGETMHYQLSSRQPESLVAVPRSGPYNQSFIGRFRSKRGRAVSDRYVIPALAEHHAEQGLPLAMDMEKVLPTPHASSNYYGVPVSSLIATTGYSADSYLSSSALMSSPPIMTATSDPRQHDDVLLYERMEMGLPYDNYKLYMERNNVGSAEEKREHHYLGDGSHSMASVYNHVLMGPGTDDYLYDPTSSSSYFDQRRNPVVTTRQNFNQRSPRYSNAKEPISKRNHSSERRTHGPSVHKQRQSTSSGVYGSNEAPYHQEGNMSSSQHPQNSIKQGVTKRTHEDAYPREFYGNKMMQPDVGSRGDGLGRNNSIGRGDQQHYSFYDDERHRRSLSPPSNNPVMLTNHKNYQYYSSRVRSSSKGYRRNRSKDSYSNLNLNDNHTSSSNLHRRKHSPYQRSPTPTRRIQSRDRYHHHDIGLMDPSTPEEMHYKRQRNSKATAADYFSKSDSKLSERNKHKA